MLLRYYAFISFIYCTKKTNTISIHATNINEARIRYWYFMFLSLTNVKISNKDFNWKKKYYATKILFY